MTDVFGNRNLKFCKLKKTTTVILSYKPIHMYIFNVFDFSIILYIHITTILK